MNRALNFLEGIYKSVFTLDLRALGLMRIAIAFVVITDLLIRASDLEAFYANSGVFPLPLLFERNWPAFHFSFHTISGLWQIQAILFFLAGICGVAMLVGYRTRLFTFLSWIFLISLHNRNPMILQGGDDLLRMMVFWGVFLPWHKRYSVDSIRNNYRTESSDHKYIGIACVGYMLQVASVYFFSALIKTSPEWRSEFTALYYAFSLDQLVFPIGKMLYPYPEVLKAITAFVFYLEFLGPFLFFIPFKSKYFRFAGVVLFIGFHLGIMATLFVGLFWIISTSALLGMLPGFAMDWVERKTGLLRNIGYKSFRELNTFTSKHVTPYIRLILNLDPIRTSTGRTVKDLALFGLIVYCMFWNIGNMSGTTLGISRDAKWLGYIFRFDQNWGMFSPGVFKDDGWYVLEGLRKDTASAKDTLIDLYRGGKVVDYKKPERVVSLFKNDRWRKYSENYLFVSHSYIRPYYCNYMTRIWNENNENKKIKKLRVVYMKEVSAPDYKPITPTREVLCECECN